MKTITITQAGICCFVLCLFVGSDTESILAQSDSMRNINKEMPPALTLDNERIQANGILRFDGKHIRLLTDVRDRNDVLEFADVFDAAVTQWCERFDIKPERARNWKLTGIVIQSPESLDRFRAAGLLPDDLPPFQAGFNRGHEMWVFAQPGEYYTRHLLLHEGTHGFMQWFLGGSGPPWFSEGMAELLAVHSWQDGKLKLGLEQSTREETPYWGRPKIIQEDSQNGLGRSLADVMSIPPTAFRDVDNYGWAWAACRFLDRHPLTQDDFRRAAQLARDTTDRFNVKFQRKIKPNLDQLEREWNLYQSEMEYGYSVENAVIERAAREEGNWLIRADRGWQRTGINIRAGNLVQIEAAGKFQIKQTTEPWISEAEGVTIEYYHGKPIGTLEAGILPLDVGQSRQFESASVGRAGEFRPETSGELVLRINDSPAERLDNKGVLTVSIKNTP